MMFVPDFVSDRVGEVAEMLKAVGRLQVRGLIDLRRPLDVVSLARLNRSYGPQAAVVMGSAAAYPDAPAVADERGIMTYRELDEQSNALGRGLLGLGLRQGDVVGLLARDHRGLALATAASGKAGLRIALLNTGFAKPQFAEVAEREQVRAIMFDSEFTGLLDALPATMPRVLTWVDEGHEVPDAAVPIESLIAANNPEALPPPAKPAGFIILTSGTTGLPKGAPRTKVSPFATVLVVDRVPFPRRGAMVIVSPIFHTTGMGTWTIGTALANKIVLMRRFDAEATLAAIAQHRAEMLVAVPTQLNRILALGPEIIGKYDTSCLRTVFVAGSALAPELATRWQDTFGEVLYNGYGSTEVAITAVAQPHELRQAPGTVGRAPVTAKIALFDAADRRITEPNIRGRIFARTVAPFEGYTDGRNKQLIDGYMSTGDMGHFDTDGLLFVDGRDDDMIVSGGENVYPLEVENLLARRPDIDEVAVVGVDDADFGKRLRAYIVPSPGATPEPQDIKNYVKANLARYKVPRDVLFLEELPRNATGKVLRRVLEQQD
ncbi:acyl-CoA synthetase [Nocardia uniformis]|uniref:Acyl-CoA synthetase n=1 Tax=Nocardia uniformis TaxID=53432 RepID=A0A849BXD9_9NOCA|nr:acyl-CoA synthetase [Nocardia uniformis]NNH71202.1 acyl-CoA synthetase [Nocardia uniformis]